MDPLQEYNLLQTRRQFFGQGGLRLGGLAVAWLGARAGISSASASNATPSIVSPHPALAGFPHFAPKAKRLIYLHMNGAPSQLDLFDYKPGLANQFDKDLPDSIRKGQRITTLTSGQSRLPVAPSMFKFAQQGKCGMWVSELLPKISEIVDEISLIKTVHTGAINHDPACTFVMTGSELPGKASLGSWLSYGLGSEGSDLPAFVVLTPQWSSKAAAQALFTRMWSSGFLPTRFTGVALRSAGDPVLYIKDPAGVDRSDRRTMLDALNQLNQASFQRFGDPEIQTRISQYEMAFRMQGSVPDLTDLSGEDKATLELYGPDVNKPGSYAASALLARRLAERGVRVVQILHRGWDQHGNLPKDIRAQCGDVDHPPAGLIKDLKQRGMLEDTLVVWGGEFGRTVYSQGKLTKDNYGRDHHPRCFSLWLAGGGVKPGFAYGRTDDYCYNIADADGNVLQPDKSKVTPGAVHVHDLQATILHLLGIDHERLTFLYQGRRFRLTDVHGHVVKDLLA